MTPPRQAAAPGGGRPPRDRPKRVVTAARQADGPGRPAPTSDPGALQTLARVGAAAEEWAPTVARLLLGVVLLWFGYHELVAPELWTGYVPVLAATSNAAEVLVLAHGWALLVIAIALLAGVAPRLAAGVASVLLLEIVISLSVSAGLSDLVLRDVGVLGLSTGVMGAKAQRLLLLR